MSKKLTTKEFIEKVKQVHGDKYKYYKVDYKGRHEKVCIICPIHGEFWQECGSHLNGKGCPMCNSSNKLTTKEFIEKAKQVHGDKYDYSKVNYINSKTKICIICPIHGEFWQTPSSHLNGIGCSKCTNKYKPTIKEFIEKAQKIHGDKYDYSKVKYINSHTKVCIICPKHGEFWQTPDKHLQGHGCSKCSNHYKYTNEVFIEKAKQVHGDKYDYSKVEYINSQTKVCIICPIHGEFYQKPNNHLLGQGCPNCNNYKLEQEIETLLQTNKIKYERNLFYKWLNSLQLDFYLPQHNIAIECQGIQHFQPVDYFGGENVFKIRIKNDEIKRKLCEKKGIKLIYYSNLHIDYPYQVYENLNDILNQIIKNDEFTPITTIL